MISANNVTRGETYWIWLDTKPVETFIHRGLHRPSPISEEYGIMVIRVSTAAVREEIHGLAFHRFYSDDQFFLSFEECQPRSINQKGN